MPNTNSMPEQFAFIVNAFMRRPASGLFNIFQKSNPAKIPFPEDVTSDVPFFYEAIFVTSLVSSRLGYQVVAASPSKWSKKSLQETLDSMAS